ACLNVKPASILKCHGPGIASPSGKEQLMRPPVPTRVLWLTAAWIVVCLCSGRDIVGREGSQAPTAEEVRDLQAKYRAERAAADQAGLPGKFPPEMFRRADQMAAKGTKALADGQLAAAREAFHEARLQLPALPAEFPEHIARVYGNFKLRHGHWVHALA